MSMPRLGADKISVNQRLCVFPEPHHAEHDAYTPPGVSFVWFVRLSSCGPCDSVFQTCLGYLPRLRRDP